jgi:hypothetical protein
MVQICNGPLDPRSCAVAALEPKAAIDDESRSAAKRQSRTRAPFQRAVPSKRDTGVWDDFEVWDEGVLRG